MLRYNIFGARGLRKAFKNMLAEVFEMYGLEPEAQRREELKKSRVWETITKHLTVFDTVSAKLRKHQPLLGRAEQWLLGGPNGPMAS